MPKARSENRDKAYELWKGSDGKMLLKDIAAALGVSDTQVRKWKNQDRWADKNKVTLPITNGNVTKQESKPKIKTGFQPGNKVAAGHGAPKGNRNAKGNKGGPGGPTANRHAEKHGFFSRIFPDDEETMAIIEEIQIKSPLDMLWENIIIQYTAIARAQRTMFVTGKDEMIKELKRSYEKTTGRTTEKTSSSSEECEYEYEFQFAWDRQATFLKAQSRAMAELRNLIKQYEEMIRQGYGDEEQQLRIEKMKAELDKIKNPTPEADMTSYVEALQSTAHEVWAEDEAKENGEDDPEGEADE